MNILIYQGNCETKASRNLKFLDALVKIDYRLIVTNNLDTLDLENCEKIKANNVQREFSSYEAGYIYCIKRFGKNINLIVANETIFDHRVFDIPFQKAFKKAFENNIKQDIPLISGVVDKLNVSYDYFNLGLIQEEFVSTWLFLINKKALECFISFEIENKYIPKFKLIQSEIFDKSNHKEYLLDIEKWVCLQGRHKKWYDNEPLTIHNREKLGLKALSIINERWVSYQLQLNGVMLDDVRSKIKRTFLQKILKRNREISNSIFWRFKRIIRGYDVW